jgi:hypothetical protein
MRESYAEFLADHRAAHRSAFNRWCLVAGDAIQIAGVVAALRARWKPAAVIFAIGVGVAIAGHVRDGNVPKSFDTVQRHPLWNIRGDLAIAKDVLTRHTRVLSPAP